MNDSLHTWKTKRDDQHFAKPDAPRLLIGIEVFCIAAMALALFVINSHQPIDLPGIAQALMTNSTQ